MNKYKIIIPGGAGFVGRNLVRFLISENIPPENITVIDKNIEGLHFLKKFKIISEKMMKKISKLFAMAKVDKSSIKDWDLHNKINKTGEQLETEIKYKRRIR